MTVPKNTFRNPSSMIGGQVIWGRVLIFGAAIVLAFILGLLIAKAGNNGVSRDVYNDVIAQRDKAEEELAQIKADQQLTRSTTPDASGTDSTSTTVAGTVDPQTGVQQYTVKSGDTWAGLASKFYGDAKLYPLIQQENGLGKNAKLTVGMQLDIPPKPQSTSSTTTKPKSSSGN